MEELHVRVQLWNNFFAFSVAFAGCRWNRSSMVVYLADAKNSLKLAPIKDLSTKRIDYFPSFAPSFVFHVGLMEYALCFCRDHSMKLAHYLPVGLSAHWATCNYNFYSYIVTVVCFYVNALRSLCALILQPRDFSASFCFARCVDE
jgi:hypothetical protein